jgi:signal recognition particle subunit SRP54
VKKQKAKQKPAKGRRRSGNPAKAALEEKAAAEKAAAAPAGGAGNPFGNPDGEEIDYAKAAEQLNLPKDFSKYLK